jgi:hypothetical protein
MITEFLNLQLIISEGHLVKRVTLTYQALVNQRQLSDQMAIKAIKVILVCLDLKETVALQVKMDYLDYVVKMEKKVYQDPLELE